MEPEEFITEIKRTIMPDVLKRTVSLKLGIIESVSGDEARVVIDGDSSATPIYRFCSASTGQRALVIKQGTQYYLIGAK